MEKVLTKAKRKRGRSWNSGANHAEYEISLGDEKEFITEINWQINGNIYNGNALLCNFPYYNDRDLFSSSLLDITTLSRFQET